MKKGFTLVELSIVLVIIGLLIGGILVAQSMISTAKLTTLYKEETQYDILLRMFKQKFSYYPGDYPQGETQMSVIGGDGNGDSLIYGKAEGKIAWQVMHVGMPEFDFECLSNCATKHNGGDSYLWPGQNTPKSKAFNAGFSLGLDKNLPGPAKNAFFIGSNGGYGGNGTHLLRGSFLTPAEALSVDTKYDDGKPTTGIVKVSKGGLCNAHSTEYDLNKNGIFCTISIQFSDY